ncbi:MAG TPA: lytic transglycosylase domain-containing protein [Myxococcales bacterium]|jgi:soluble lytic murein transglycosylase
MGGGGGVLGRVVLAISASFLLGGPARADRLPAVREAAPEGPPREPTRTKAILSDDDEAFAAQAAQLGILAAIEGGRGGLLPRQAKRMAVALVREARRNGLDPQLVAAVAEVESHYDPFAISSQGAVGVMQVMPATARWLGGSARKALRDRELFDFELNLVLGTGYLAQLIKEFSSLEAALLAYNAGPTGARKLLASGLRPKLADYPKRVLEAYRRLSAANPEESEATTRSSPDGTGG